jgi:hypothetical protein
MLDKSAIAPRNFTYDSMQAGMPVQRPLHKSFIE